MLGIRVVLALSATGCTTLLWHNWPKTRTYTYDRPVSIEVRSEPAGATIVDDTGAVLGMAPMTLHTHHTVERTHQSRNKWALVVGCAASMTVAVLALREYSAHTFEIINPGTPNVMFHSDNFTSTRQRVLFLGSFAAAMDCLGNAFTVGLEGLVANSDKDSIQVQLKPYDKITVDERVLPRTVKIEARWPDWSPVGGSVVVPTQSLLTLRRGHAGTFDDAIIRRSRTATPLGPEGLYRAGQAYVRMARETKDPAHAELAIAHFTRYLATPEVADARRTEVDRLIAEMKAVKR